MGIQAISAEIISKYQTLNKMAHIKPKDNVTVPFWKLNMENWGVSQGLGYIWCLKKAPVENAIQKQEWGVITTIKLKKEIKRETLIDAHIGRQDVEIKTKPFWMRKIKALQKIDEALTQFIKNFDDNTVVKKGEAPVVVYTEEFANFLSGKNPNFKRITYDA